MSTEDLLVNIEVDTKSAKRGVDDLNQSLAENTKQTKAIQKELERLEKEYKAIATAAKKLPTQEAALLTSEVKKAERATARLSDQFERTGSKLEKVHERTIGAAAGFSALTAAITTLANLDTLIKFTDRVNKAAQAVLQFSENAGPTLTKTRDLFKKGFEQGSHILSNFTNVAKTAGAALTEHRQIMEGYQHVAVGIPRMHAAINDSFRGLASAAKFFERGFVAIRDFAKQTQDGVGRVRTLFKTLRDGSTTAMDILGQLGGVFGSTFGSGTGGAASINSLQRAYLSVQEVTENFGKTTTTALGRVAGAFRSLLPSTKGFLTAAQALTPALVAVGAGVGTLGTLLMTFGAASGPVMMAAGALTMLAAVAGNSIAKSLGRQSGGAAAVGVFQSLLLDLRFAAEQAAVRLGAVFQSLGTLLQDFAAKGAQAALPFLQTFGARAIALGKHLETLAARGMSVFLKGLIDVGLRGLQLGQNMGVLGKGFIGLIDNTALMGGAMLGLGTLLKRTDSIVLDSIGSFAQLVGVLSISLSAGLTLVTGLLGQFALAVGGKLFAISDVWEEKFTKMQKVTQAFEFTIRGFNKTLGEGAVGSLASWNTQIEKMTSTTVFGAAEVQKSIKLLVAGGSQLGITAEQNTQLLQRAGDLAAITGQELSEVSQAIARGLSGEAGALKSMGVSVDNVALQNSKLAKAQGLVVSELTQQARAQLVANMILEQTTPLVGAATAQLDTIAGSQKQLAQTTELLQAKLGGQSVVWAQVTQAQTSFIAALTRLPEGVYDVISATVDVTGVFLKLAGTFLTTILTIAGIKGIFELLTLAIGQSRVVQVALNTVINILRVSVGLQTVAITTLKTAMLALGQTVIPGLTLAIKNFQATLIVATQRVYAFVTGLLFTKVGWATIIAGATKAAAAVARFTVVLLANPWTYVIGGIIATVVAMQQLGEELDQLKDRSDAANGGLSKTPGFLEQLANAARNVGQVFVDIAKVIIIGWLKILRVLELAAVGYQKLWAKITGNTAAMENLQTEQDALLAQLVELEVAYDRTFGGGTAMAATMAAEVVGLAGKFGELRSASQTRFDLGLAGAQVGALGTDFEKATLAIKTAHFELGEVQKEAKLLAATFLSKAAAESFVPKPEMLNKLVAQMKAAGKETKALEEITAKVSEASLRKLGAESAALALRNKTADDAARSAVDARKAELEAAGRVIEKIQLETQEKLKVKQAELEGLARLGQDISVRREQVAQINQAIKAIKQQEAAQIAAAKAAADAKALELQAKQLAALGDILKVNTEISNKNKESGEFALDRISRELAQSLLLVQSKREELKLNGLLSETAEKALIEQERLLKAGAGAAAAKAPSREFEAAKAVGTGAADGITQAFQAGTAGVVMGALTGVSAMADVVQGLIDFLPDLLNKIAGIFNSLAELPLKIAEGLSNIFDAYLNYVANFLPNIIKAVDKILLKAVEFIEKLPDVFVAMLQKIPEMLTGLAERIPEMAERFVFGLVEGIPKMVIALVEYLVRDAPRIAIAIAYALNVALPKAIVKGLIAALKAVGSMIANLFKGIRLPTEQFSEGLNSLATATTNEASKLFKVLDLEAAARGEAAAKEIEDTLNRGINRLVEAWRALWAFIKQIWEGIVAALQFLWDTLVIIWNGVITALTMLWDVLKVLWDVVILALSTLWENLKTIWGVVLLALGALWDALKVIWDVVILALTAVWDLYKKGFEVIVAALGKSWETIKAIWDGLKNVVTNAFKVVTDTFTNLKSTVDAAFQSVLTTFSTIGSTIWEQLKSGLGGVGKVIKDQLDLINPANMFNKMFAFNDTSGEGTVEKTLGIKVPYANFAEGGMVPGNALVGGDSLMNDRILALLSPGEAVIPRSKMADPTVRALVDQILAGQLRPPRLAFGEGGDLNPFDDGGGFSPAGALGQVWGGLSSAAQASIGPIASVVNDTLDPAQISELAKAIEQGAVDLKKSPAGAIASAAGATLGDAVTLLQAAGGTISGVGKKALGDANAAIEKAGAMVSWLDPSQLWTKVKEEAYGSIIKMFEANRFHSGGLVPEGGDVPSMLQSGEFVINRQAVQSLGLGALTSLNRGQAVGNQAYNFEINLNLKADGLPDESFIRQRLIPTVKQELKAASLRGEFLFSDKGIRKT